jgi:hypothetical protein
MHCVRLLSKGIASRPRAGVGTDQIHLRSNPLDIDTSLALFQVDKLTDIAWNDTAFGQLVLPHDYKSIIWAFVDAQMSQTDDDFDDIIEGKGKIIYLSHATEP